MSRSRLFPRDASTASGTGDLHVVLDFFKGDPQWSSLYTLRAPGAAEEATTRSHEPYWADVQNIRENEMFLEGMLLKSLESEASYPYIQYIIYNNKPSERAAASSFVPSTTRSKNGNKQSKIPNHQLIDIVASQGGYREMFTFVDHQTPLLPKRPQNPNAAYIISAFKANGPVQELDRSWSYWSGADLIVEAIPQILKLQRITFHKIKYDLSLDSFVYVLLCELGDALKHQNRALEFVATLKDRQCGTSSLYAIEHYF